MAEFHTPIKSKIDAQITIPPSPFLIRLGYGTATDVMQLARSPRAGQMRSPWALKMLNKRVKRNKIYSERLHAEAELLQRMSHPNIVGFRAFSNTKILYLGMEACDLSLGERIEKRVEEVKVFRPSQILKVTLDIGKALHYLHTKMQILHGDIKSYNVLVNGDFVICKLCDFGVTVPLDENGVLSEGSFYYGTEAWSAPEVIQGGEINTKTDIWPLGLTMWEMMALMIPHSQPDDTLDTSISDDSMGEDYLVDRYGTRPAIPANIDENMYNDALALFYICTETSTALRPTAEHLSNAAAEMLDKCSDGKFD